MAGSSVLYREASPSCLSLGSFPWREVALEGLPGVSPSEAAGKTEARELAGGFHYKGSALVASPCRNRFILWHYEADALRLLEVSLDTDLARNALKLVLKGPGTLLPDVSILELGNTHVVVLFATASTVFRLMLPHPEAVIKDPKLAVVGEGVQPSVLAFASADSFKGSNMAATFSQPSSMVPLTGCSSWISASRLTTFALPSPTGTIFLVQLPPPSSHGLPIRTELKETSVMHKLWSSLMPASIRGSGEVEDAPVSVVMHVFGRETIVVALCRDLTIKLWSCQQAECLMTHSLADYLQCEDDLAAGRVDKLLLKKAPNGTTNSLRFGVYMAVSGAPQISMFQLLLIDNQLMLNNLHNYSCPPNGTLIDFQPSNCEVWGVWRRRRGGVEGEETLVQRAVYDGDSPSWRTVSLSPPSAREVFIPSHLEPREVYLRELLHPGRFSTLALCKTLELYGGASVKESSATLQELGREATSRVERELLASASSYDLDLEGYRELQLKCWSKFYGCCHEYQGLLSRPLSLFHDPSTGMAALLQRGTVSFLHPASPVDCLREGGQHLVTLDPVLAAEVATFLECVKLTADQLPPDVLESFLEDLAHHHGSPVTLAMELASVLQDNLSSELAGSELTLIEKLTQSLARISDVASIVELLVRVLDPCKHGDVSEDMDSEDPVETELQLAISQLFAGHVTTVILGASLQELCYGRLQLCRDVMVLLCLVCVLCSVEVSPSIDEDYLMTFSSLLQHYHTLYWFTSQPALPTNTNTFEANLKQLAALEISSGRGSRSSSTSAPSSTLVELYLSTQGEQELRTSLVRGRVLPPATPFHPHWASVLPRMIDIILRQLWPSTSSCAVCEFMLANCQYTHLQDYVAMVNVFVPMGTSSRDFLLGQCHLSKGEVYEARECFERASNGVGDQSEPLLQRVTSVGGEGEGGDGRLVQYYIKVVRLFEQLPAPSLVIKVADEATQKVDQRDPNCAILWSTLFKYHLELGHSEEAYEAMMGNPDPARRSDCLRRLVFVLTERCQLKRLCSFTYAGMEDEIEKVIEERARTVDITKHGYYDLLYCFHTTRGNFRKSAYVMYEHGLRLGREAPGPKSLQKQANCYCMALTALSLTPPKYAWVVRPVELEEAALPMRRLSKRKRAHPSQQGSTKRCVEVLTIADIEKEYILVRAKLRLMQRDPAMATQLSSPFVSAEEVVALLVQTGLFDTAIDIALHFSVSMFPIFEALAARCVHLSVNVVAFRHGVDADTSNWDWLGLNESVATTTTRENSIADQAWSLLRSHLQHHDHAQNYRLQECVARKLFSMGAQLPQWMVDTYKVTNPAELLRLYLTFDLVESATLLALEYIDAVMGHGKEFFGMKTALHATSPSVWLPYSTLDHLQQALQTAPSDSSLAQLSQEFTSKLDQYFHLLNSVSGDMEHEAQHRHRQLLRSL